MNDISATADTTTNHSGQPAAVIDLQTVIDKVGDSIHSTRATTLALETVVNELGDPLARLLEDNCRCHADPSISNDHAARLRKIPNALRGLICSERVNFNRNLEILAEITGNTSLINLPNRKPEPCG